MATIAVFIALGGTSYAVATGSIDSREIKNNSVRGKDIRNNEVRSRDVRNGTLLSKDFKVGELPPGPRGATGAQGPIGSRGATGPADAVITGDTPPSGNFSGTFNFIFPPRSGRLFLYASTELDVECTTGAPQVGLYLDNTPVPGSLRDFSTAGPWDVQLFGVTSNRIAAGRHGLAMAGSCSDGTQVTSFASLSNRSIGAIVLGG
jgi:hypothetical protein